EFQNFAHHLGVRLVAVEQDKSPGFLADKRHLRTHIKNLRHLERAAHVPKVLANRSDAVCHTRMLPGVEVGGQRIPVVQRKSSTGGSTGTQENNMGGVGSAPLGGQGGAE